MSERGKVTEQHRRRRAVVYVRQSTLHAGRAQLESAARQYALRERAIELGWPAESVSVVDEDTGRSGARPTGGSGSRSWSPRSGSGRSGWCSRWRSRGSRAPRRTGISCWICAR